MRTLAIALALSCLGCAGLSLAQVARGAAWLGDVIGAAQAGADAYYRRHPNQESEHQLALALKRTRLAIAELSGAVAADDALAMAKARTEALRAYGEVVYLLAELGVLSGEAIGGAETDAPAPGRLALPSVAQIAMALE